MEYLVYNPSATRKELAEAIPNCTVDGIKYNLGKLQKMGVITRVGSTKSGHWKVLVDLKGNSYDS